MLTSWEAVVSGAGSKAAKGKGEDEEDWSKLGGQTDSLRVSVPID
ncbi:hypothetical protein HMPREF0972_01370 [Actinomyces sp. oral taxon 848 str. F0332]|nr:hypothetical protein HMPREF0972_01370 [Actinomyces sp. oral taxon 848 str. F0332]